MQTPSPVIAEVTQSSLHSWHAITTQWDQIPEFGSLVLIPTPSLTLFGLVHQITTGSADSVHTPLPLGKTPEALQREYPQIFTFLRTTISCLTLGYEQQERIHYQWAPLPAPIHAFVYAGSNDAYQRIFSEEMALKMIFNMESQILSLDELLLALVTQLLQRKLLDAEHLDRFVEQIALLTGNDYRRLKLFLQRIEACLHSGYQEQP